MQRLHDAWLVRRPVVVELAVAPAVLNEPERCDRPPYELSAGFTFQRERLAFLVWANNYDFRSGELIWWHGRKAERTLPGTRAGGEADLVLGDNAIAYVDGGPPQPPGSASGPPVITRWNAEAGAMQPVGRAAPAVDLARDQLAAVGHRAGPARVIAPAGSGKTRVLTERLRHLVVDRHVHPGSITALAFNTKAAEELRTRCADFHSPAGPHIRTLNSLGLWICNTFGGAGQMRVLDEPAARDLIQRIYSVRRQANTDTVVPYIDGLSTIRLSLVRPDEAEEEVPDAPGLGDGFAEYRAALAAAGAVDFDEQIYRAIEILLTTPAAREAAQRRCRHLLVDEFQDLNPAHVLLIRLLCAPGFDCFGVGDDDQVIYDYAGADPAFLINYRDYFPGAAEHALEVNYRCPAPIVDAARHVLAYNRRRVAKEIRSVVEGGPEALEVHETPADGMAAETVEVLRNWIAEGTSPGEIAVLARVNSALLPVQISCGEAGIPCSTPVTADVLSRTGVRTALAYLRIGLDPRHIRAADVRETIRRPSRGISPLLTEMLTKPRGTSLEDLRRLAGKWTGRDAPKLDIFADDVERLATVCGKSSTATALRFIRVGLGLDDTMEVLDSSRREADRSTHADDLVALESVALLHPDPVGFEEWLRATFSRPASGGPRVLLSTIHKIKGREWPRVVIYGASTGLLPHRLSHDIEAERRVFHVALTRCRERVVVVAPDANKSIFIDELTGSRTLDERRPLERPSNLARSAAAGVARRDRRQPPRGGPSAEPVRERPAGAVPAEEALRTWRRTAAARDSVKPYVILSDKELIGIADRQPDNLRALARCPGIGPIRLERWGDEILSVIRSAGAVGSNVEP